MYTLILLKIVSFVSKITTALPAKFKNASTTDVVTKVIFEAATDEKNKLRYMAGKDAKLYNLLNKWYGYNFILSMNKKFFKL